MQTVKTLFDDVEELLQRICVPWLISHDAVVNLRGQAAQKNHNKAAPAVVPNCAYDNNIKRQPIYAHMYAMKHSAELQKPQL